MIDTGASHSCTRMNRRLGMRRREHGFTLVEILVAMLVMSVGLLGVAGLHAWSLRGNYDALVRSHASALAGDIVDRMRANRANALVDDSPYITPLEEEEIADPQTDAERDLAEWKRVLAAQLPNGKGAIEVNEVTRMVIITIQWGERTNTVFFRTQTEI